MTNGDKLTLTSTGRLCKATNARGEPCAAYAVEGSAFCFWHCPELAEARKAARVSGGLARHGRTGILDASRGGVQLETVGDVLVLLERALSDALVLENSIARARAVGYLVSVAVKVLEVTELERRVTRLEERQAERELQNTRGTGVTLS